MEISFSEEEKSIYYRGSYGFWALAKFFCITLMDATALFVPPYYRSKYDPPNKDILTDKQLWLARVRNFLSLHEEA